MVAALIERLVPAVQPDEIYLFGSQARDDARAGSDYDVLLIVPASDEPAYRRQQAAYRALWGLGVPVDVVVLTRAEFERQARVVTSLPATIRREGRRVYAACAEAASVVSMPR
ncbi:MAG: nucleotidyltransferase domain-containing protein [Chloroflexi bacterium]|nr:nucleotidyltransferase domain-containing protein [Chloroflexota bacterium]